MPLVGIAELLSRPLAAFNVITLEHAEAIVTGAEAAGLPAVLQISQNAVRYHGGRIGPLAAACRSLAEDAAVPLALHLDHADDDEVIRAGLLAGVGSLMVDASTLPYERNVRRTRAVAERAHASGLWVEAELGTVGGKDGASPLGAHAPGARTDPDAARDFVAATGVDGLAVAIGSSHAMTRRTADLDLDLLRRLRLAVDVPLVLHGSSGVPDDLLVAAVRAGIVKVNIGTALNVAFTGAVRERLAATGPAEVDPRRYLARGRDAAAAEVARLIAVITRPDAARP